MQVRGSGDSQWFRSHLPLNRLRRRNSVAFTRVKAMRAAFSLRMKAPLSHVSSGQDFYLRILDVLGGGSIEFLVGGAFALRVHTGIERDTKDFDIMLRPRDVERVLGLCRNAGFQADYAFSHWIAKIHFGEHFIDLIYRAGNGLCEVDDKWFERAREAEVLGRPLLLCPVEEMIWQKAYIMERERYDGADVLHLLRSNAATLDWNHLISRFGEDWRVLFSHLVLFGYVYPQQRADIPLPVMDRLIAQFRDELAAPPMDDKLCRGPLLSRAQYLSDIERWGYRDPRFDLRFHMTPEEILSWTNAIDRVNRSK
jgi:hypothetical protein